MKKLSTEITTKISRNNERGGNERGSRRKHQEIFEKLHDCWSEYMSLGEAAIFEYAFKLGARLMVEVMREDETK